MSLQSCVRAGSGLLGAALVTLLAGCGTSDSRQAALMFPATVSAQGYSSQGALGSGLAQDPAETAAINPFDPIALNNLAVMEAGRGRYQQASSLLQRAVKLAPARADIAANLSNLQRWLAQAEGQAAVGLAPQPLQLPYQEAGVPEVPPIWVAPTLPAAPPAAPVAVPAPMSQRVSMSAESLFAFDGAAIKPEGRAALDKLARDLASAPYARVTVEGHTDRLGASAYNQRLSEARAMAVKNHLVTSGRLDGAKVFATGKGETQPVTKPGDCPGTQRTAALLACLQPDRRVDVEVTLAR